MTNRLKAPLIPAFLAIVSVLALVTAACGDQAESPSENTDQAILANQTEEVNQNEQAAPVKFDAANPPANLVSDSFEEVQGPDSYRARFMVKGKGNFVIEVTRAWAPRGADRFYSLVKGGYFQHAPFFRVIGNFMAQFGESAWPEVTAKWSGRNILDDHEVTSAKLSQSNRRGTVTFACAGADSRTTQVFINFRDNPNLNPPSNGGVFTPFGKVIEGMDVVDALYAGHGDILERRSPKGVSLRRFQAEGLPYILENFPLIDIIENAVIE